MRIVVLAKDKPGLDDAVEFLKAKVSEVEVVVGTRNDKFPSELFDIETDILVSYLSPWIIPDKILIKIKKVSVNFHPGPPQYPGSGCTNFALYNEEKEFGVTAHLMDAKVDTGKIILVSRFPIYPNDSVLSLTQRCYEEISRIFPSVMKHLLDGDNLPDCTEQWTRKPYTRRELDDLCRITPDMSKNEVKRRVRATVFPNMPGPFVEINGYRFEYKEDEKK